jgi:hypothetical protein
MPSVARVSYIPLRALALNVIANYSRSRRKRRKPDSMTTVDPRAERHYRLDELTELRRNTLRYPALFLPATSAISTGSSLSRFGRFSETRNGCGLTLEGAMLSNDRSGRNES